MIKGLFKTKKITIKAKVFRAKTNTWEDCGTISEYKETFWTRIKNLLKHK